MASYSTLWPYGPVVRSFVQYLIAFCSRPKTASGVISSGIVGPILQDKPVELCDPRLNHSMDLTKMGYI